MTLRPRVIATCALLFASSCWVDDCYSTLGGSCSDSGDCEDFDNDKVGVCVAVDGDPSEAVCVPTTPLPVTSCDDVDDCIDEAFPIDAECEDSVCVCNNFGGSCADTLEGGEFSAQACACTVDGGALKSDGESCFVGSECSSGSCFNGFCSDQCDSDDDCSSFDCDEVGGTCL